MDWGSMVKEARQVLGMSQEEAAKFLGVSQPTVSQIERGLSGSGKPGEWRPRWEFANRIKALHLKAKRKARDSSKA